MSIIGKAPVTYVEWRTIYQSELYHLGTSSNAYWKFKTAGLAFLVESQIRIVWKLHRRIERIESHLNRFWDRMDATLADELLDMCMGDDE